jgi:GTP-binding protein
MSKPIVAVVGRPNVGKSTLFNKLCGQRLAIVEDTPGITRDRIFANCEWNGHDFLLVDTGGIEPKATEGILAHMREQAQIAIDTADCIIMVVDVRDGLTAADEDVAHMLRRSHKPIILAVNKCDKVGDAPMEMYEFYNLGFDEVMPISSVHGHGTGDLLDAVCAHLDFSETVVEEDRIPVAIIGRPNVGKSSLTNRILGENRMIVANEAGTTRDAIDTPVDNAYGKFIFTDTAGLRKRSNITDGLERYMVVRALAAVERSRVAPPSALPSRTARWPVMPTIRARRASSSSTSGTRWKARRPTPWSCSAAIMPSASALWAMLLSSSSRLRPATT